MAKFKVGDLVRALQDSGLGAFLAGKEYEVLAVRDERITAINERGQRDSWGEHHFEHLQVVKAPEDKPAFKVGDRVRLTTDKGDGRSSGSIGVIEKMTNSYARVLFDAPFNGWGETGRNWHAQLSDLVAAPFKIEAGKYYRTRDGRKVGPMKDFGWKDGFPFNDEEVVENYFSPDGKAQLGDDLIAEWVDEPVKAAAPVQFILRNDVFSFAPVAKPAIVALIENGQPKPSVAPFVHANETLAAKEAARLASLQKGKEFGVYVMTQKVSEPAPSYKHEWQRFAAKGEKISAIKELRSVTGLGLKAAKDAVEHWIAHDEPYSRIAA